MQIKNYAAQACRDLTDFIELMARKSDQADDAKALRELVAQIEASVHFAIPDYGRIFDDEFKGLHDLELRLPFPSVTLEYTIPSDEGVDQSTTFHSPKRVVFAREVSTEAHGMRGLSELVREQLAVRLKDTLLYPDGRGILVWGASSVPWQANEADLRFSPELCMWLLPGRYPEEAEIEYDRVKKMGKEGLSENSRLRRRSGVVLGYSLVSMYSTIAVAHDQGITGQDEIDAFIDHISSDIAQEAAVVLEFIEAMSCSNIKHEVAQAAPKASVAAKRKRAGKLPIFETRVLTVSVPGQTTSGSAKTSLGESGRSSPRQHLRRGHIRRLESGKRIWVQSAVIGGSNNGSIAKSYRLTT